MGLACVFRNVGFPPLPLDARSGEGRAGEGEFKLSAWH